jgi:hypothetical protein
MASTSVSKTESPGSNPGAPAKIVSRGKGLGKIEEVFRQMQGIGNV